MASVREASLCLVPSEPTHPVDHPYIHPSRSSSNLTSAAPFHPPNAGILVTAFRAFERAELCKHGSVSPASLSSVKPPSKSWAVWQPHSALHRSPTLFHCNSP